MTNCNKTPIKKAKQIVSQISIDLIEETGGNLLARIAV